MKPYGYILIVVDKISHKQWHAFSDALSNSEQTIQKPKHKTIRQQKSKESS